LRDISMGLPPASSTRDRLSALFSSKLAEAMLSSTAVKRTAALAVNDWAVGEISASMV